MWSFYCPRRTIFRPSRYRIIAFLSRNVHLGGYVSSCPSSSVLPLQQQKNIVLYHIPGVCYIFLFNIFSVRPLSEQFLFFHYLLSSILFVNPCYHLLALNHMHCIWFVCLFVFVGNSKFLSKTVCFLFGCRTVHTYKF